jgi:hypothetical protein
MTFDAPPCPDPDCPACQLLKAVANLKENGATDEVVIEMFGDVLGIVYGEETVH